MMLIAGIQRAIKLHVVLSAALCVHHINVAYMYTSLAFVDKYTSCSPSLQSMTELEKILGMQKHFLKETKKGGGGGGQMYFFSR